MGEGDGAPEVRTNIERDQWGTSWIVERERQDDGAWIEVSRVKEAIVAAADRVRSKGTKPNPSLKTVTFSISSTSAVTKIHAWERDAAGALWFITFELVDGILQQTDRVRAHGDP